MVDHEEYDPVNSPNSIQNQQQQNPTFSYGNHKDRALFCKIMRNLDAAELKQSRSVPTDEMKTQLINLMLAEHKKARNMPPAYPLGELAQLLAFSHFF
jgi:hypothetical protein